MGQGQQVVVGLDNGGTTNNATVLDAATGKFLVDGLVETPSRVREGPAVAVGALAESFEHILQLTGLDRSAVLGIGLDTPGRPAPPGSSRCAAR
jgi:N-acetylglucosamine kinase-like BadF-type ATPase